MVVVHAVDIEPSLLTQAPPDLQTLPWRGPTLLSLRPLQGGEVIESVLQAVGGIAQAAQPNLWQSPTMPPAPTSCASRAQQRS